MSSPSDPVDPLTSLSRRFPRVALTITLVLAAILLAVFFQQVQEHRFRNDDTYISFRYSRHLADGLGLVWNPGEPVEGYTNFLWVLIVAGAMKLGLRAEPFTDAFSPLCGALLLLSVAAFAARRVGWRNPWILAAPAVLVASHSFTGWAGSGMETVFFALLIWSAWGRFLTERADPSAGRRWSPWLFAAAALTRPDGLLFAGIAGMVALLDVVRKRCSPREFLMWATPLVAIVGAHFLWRRAYYGFWWPNTFYAKVNSLHPEQGLRYLAEFHRVYLFGYFLPLLFVPLIRRASTGWLLVPVVGYAGYLVAIGGDTFEFRFLVFLLPFAVALIAEGLRFLMTFRPRFLLAALGTAILVVLVTVTWRGTQSERAGRFGGHQIRTFFQLNAVAEANMKVGHELAALLEDGSLPSDLVVCLPTVGALPYVTGLVTIDYHGLNDVRIARMPVTGTRLAHEHEAPIEYLQERRVDMHLADRSPIRRNRKAVFREREKPLRPYWKDVPFENGYLSFASYVSEERFREAFGVLLDRAEDAEGVDGAVR